MGTTYGIYLTFSPRLSQYEYLQVIQKILERVAPERLGFVQAFKGSVYELSTHPYGCRVLQRVFEHLKEDQTRPLLDELHKYTINLMQDQFGVSNLGQPRSFRANLLSNYRTMSCSSCLKRVLYRTAS